MIRSLFCFMLSCFMVFTSCQHAGSSAGAGRAPSGKFLNRTVLNSCPDKMPFDVPNYCYELSFNGKDSVMIDNGFENYTLPFVKTGQPAEFMIPKASAAGDMVFRMLSDTTLELIDTAWTKIATPSTYGKVTNPTQQSWGFKEFLNDCVIAGEYALFTDGQLQTGTVNAMVNGQLNGMKPYIGYALCYAGDCLGETDPPSNTIDLIDNRGHVETFSYKTIGGKMAIELYSLGEGSPDVKGERPIGKLKYELRTE